MSIASETKDLNLRIRDFSILTDMKLNQLAIIFEMTKAELVRFALEEFVTHNEAKLA